MRIAILAVPFLLAVTCHEVAHGLAAYWYGDPTAKFAGRLTFNPIRHMDPMGTLVFLLTALTSGFIIGWAKPVPINPRNFRDIRKGIIVVSAAGAAMNFLLAVALYAVFALMLAFPPAPGGMGEFFFVPLVNIVRYGVLINVILGVFNLLPIPPLDGSKILAELLPPRLAYKYMQLERYGFIILLVLVMTGMLRFVFAPVLSVLAPLLHMI
ncbi:Zn-dependent protease [Desulfobaculum xiamenense]|uniref:Zn-dependent protease n=1 Tax=Desulfobaculum xiamenense TaxID=995050 RepID=A0A846QG14_9BACT|nr:Zn-dependent protease [Desulfobaculum xiamenense]